MSVWLRRAQAVGKEGNPGSLVLELLAGKRGSWLRARTVDVEEETLQAGGKVSAKAQKPARMRHQHTDALY